MGPPKSAQENDSVSESGLLTEMCPNDAFTETYTRESQFYCLFFSLDDLESVVENLVLQNAGNLHTLNTIINYLIFNKFGIMGFHSQLILQEILVQDFSCEA